MNRNTDIVNKSTPRRSCMKSYSNESVLRRKTFFFFPLKSFHRDESSAKWPVQTNRNNILKTVMCPVIIRNKSIIAAVNDVTPNVMHPIATKWKNISWWAPLMGPPTNVYEKAIMWTIMCLKCGTCSQKLLGRQKKSVPMGPLETGWPDMAILSHFI